jgi:hypothetical protein
MKSRREPPAAESAEDGRPPDPDDHRLDAPGDYLNHFQQIATMIELLDRLPEIAGDIRDWRPQTHAGHLAEAPRGENDEILRAYGELSPLMQRAFQAVVAGLDKLADSAVDLYDHTHKPPTPSEIEAGAEIGGSMRRLLERAMALVASARPHGGAGRSPEMDAIGARAVRRRH